MDNENLKIADHMHMRDKLEKSLGILITDMMILAACMLPLAINSILYWLNQEHREGISYAVYVSLMAAMFCNLEVINSITTYKRIKSCIEESEAKLINIKRFTFPHFNTLMTLFAFIGTINVLNFI